MNIRSVRTPATSTVDLVTAEIRRAVLTGDLEAGAPFSIRDLATQLEVSHIPIREALRRLESQGLIVMRQARSAQVAALSEDDLTSIYRLRFEVEVPLAGASAGKHSDEQLTELSELLELSRSENPEVAWQAHYDFHAALVAPAATLWDIRIMQTLWMAAERYTHLVFDPTRITEAEAQRRFDTHAVLLTAAQNDDAPAMERALTAHLRHNEQLVCDAIAALHKPTARPHSHVPAGTPDKGEAQ